MCSDVSRLLDYVLEDDDTPTGGTAFQGETVGDFISSVDEDFCNLDELNDALRRCGIKPVRIQGRDGLPL